MTTLEELGLLKMDFLGLRTLTVIQNAARLAEDSTGKPLDMAKIDYDDKAVFDSLCSGRIGTGCSSWKPRKRIHCMIGVMYLRISITSTRTGQKKRIFYQN